MTTETITALADCWANSLPNNVDSNFNKQGLGMGMITGGLNRSFLKFSLKGCSSDPNKLVKAELKLYGARWAGHLTAKVRAYHTLNGFSETTLTWNNQPPPTTYVWDGSGSLMGETGDIPNAASWYTVPINPVFVKARWNLNFLMILTGTEEPESYCYASDREEAGGAYAPKLILTTEEAPPLSATLSASPTAGNVPLAVTFTIGISDGYPPYTWTLDYGEPGSTLGSGTVPGTKAWVYTKAGSYTATLTVTDALGASMFAQTGVGAGVIQLFPNLRKLFPNLFAKLDELRNKIRGLGEFTAYPVGRLASIKCGLLSQFPNLKQLLSRRVEYRHVNHSAEFPDAERYGNRVEHYELVS